MPTVSPLFFGELPSAKRRRENWRSSLSVISKPPRYGRAKEDTRRAQGCGVYALRVVHVSIVYFVGVVARTGNVLCGESFCDWPNATLIAALGVRSRWKRYDSVAAMPADRVCDDRATAESGRRRRAVRNARSPKRAPTHRGAMSVLTRLQI